MARAVVNPSLDGIPPSGLQKYCLETQGVKVRYQFCNSVARPSLELDNAKCAVESNPDRLTSATTLPSMAYYAGVNPGAINVRAIVGGDDGAVVARELGVPMVGDAALAVPEGTVVTVDGDRGVVYGSDIVGR